MKTHIMNPRALLRAASLHTNKRLGQHFLIDPNTLRRIVAAAELHEESVVLEIGAGTGALTALLAESARHVLSVEIDERLRPVLAETLTSYKNVDLQYADFLQLDFAEAPSCRTLYRSWPICRITSATPFCGVCSKLRAARNAWCSRSKEK